MVNFILRIVLVISLFFNVMLYFGYMDVGQYRTYLNNLAKDGQEIIESDQFQNLITLIKDKFQEAYGKDIEVLKKEVETKIQEVGEEKAVEMIQEKYNKLTEADVKSVVDEVTKTEK